MSKDKTKRNTAYFHLPGLFEFYELYRICLYIQNTESTFMTGVRLALSTEHHRIASGAAAVWKMKPVIRVML